MKQLISKRLVLKSMTLNDAEALYHYRRLPIVSQYQSWDHYTLDMAQNLILQNQNLALTKQPGSYQWGIFLNQQLIGDLFWQIEIDGSCWLGYTLDPHYWHHGYAYEAVATLIKILHYIFHISCFYAHILDENQASLKLIQSLGFQLVYPQVYCLNQWYNSPNKWQ